MKRLITRSVAQETEDRMQNGRKRNPGGLNWSNQIVKPSFKILLGVKKIKSCRFRDLERSRVQFIINTQNSLSTSFFAWFETRCECDCDTAARRCALIWLLATGPRSVRVNHHLSRELGHFMAGLQLLHLSWSLLRKEKKKIEEWKTTAPNRWRKAASGGRALPGSKCGTTAGFLLHPVSEKTWRSRCSNSLRN